jgi:hypothetical protein
METAAMSISKTFLAVTTGTAHATGNQTATEAGTGTLAGPGVAVGFAAAVAFADNSGPGGHHTDVATNGFVSGGYITMSQTNQWSVNSPFGPTPVSLDASVTVVSTHGGGGDSLSGLIGPSLHGLF